MTDINTMRREYRGGIIYSNSWYFFNYVLGFYRKATRRTYYRMVDESYEHLI